MLVCKNCDHENPEGATICEVCYTSFSMSNIEENIKCPNCGAEILRDSTFCGQCGSKLAVGEEEIDEPLAVDLGDDKGSIESSDQQTGSEFQENESKDEISSLSSLTESGNIEQENKSNQTQLQLQRVILFHLQTKTEIDIPLNLSVIHIGKMNSRVPPDIDISGFPDSQIVSRVHADILKEGDDFFIEDTGSANGTYINHIPLPTGNRHRLRDGDRIALGKEDKVSFIFKITEK